MHIKKVWIRNFRALEDINADLDSRVSVIVGPNAAGKTTIIEAIRFAKALLAPRTQQEANQVLHSLGASSPHLPQRLRIDAIARDPAKAISVGCAFELSADEIGSLIDASDALVMSLIQAQGGQSFANPDTLIAFLASPQGQAMQAEAKNRVATTLTKVQTTKRCNLEITWAPGGGPQSAADPVEVQFVAYLERRLPPNKTAFTYFPADRALPLGDQPVQLGGPDAAAQLESYNSQPQAKFNRLKNLIFSGVFLSSQNQPAENSIEREFERIFSGILKGRKLERLEINEIGLLNVLIRDTESQRVFDMDGMSSGEKGLILTFLLLARSVVDNGIVLLDEPELHLNPAVCKDILSYLVNEYVKPKNLQVIVCSHSPEILAGAFDNDECSLFHLVSTNNLSKIRLQDEVNLEETLRRLGATESENLLYKGIVFVEGPHDVAILESGFGFLLRRYKLKFAQGRQEIEKAVRSLQEHEQSGVTSTPTYFIFDRDDAPTPLKSSASVKVLQWDRRCLENYFIDLDAISSVLMDEAVVKQPLKNQGEVSTLLRSLAFQQLPELAAKRVYERYAFGGLGIRREDLPDKTMDQISQLFLNRIMAVKDQLNGIDISTWKTTFENEVETERKQLEAIWETTWMQDCDGKRLIDDLSKKVTFRSKVKAFKIRLIKEMALSQSANWKAIEGKLKALLSVST
ncbi:ATP-dependent nuclease [Pandoraea cepalis]|uniref:DNA replication and repair protein RecF n=1 Tax=Pandoraea cepalis TaxID=2508294 RepID=A0A5E4TTJ0_9BURK|nr:AAA family ATPase [Pandoraea cepalis]VVD91246.1 DNA replication and repair protein RecF [Pandoraea cepalis]